MQSKCAVQLEVLMSVLYVVNHSTLEVSVAPLPCCTQSACTGMAHPSIYPPLLPGSWILLHGSQVSYSPFCTVDRSRTHTLISQVHTIAGAIRYQPCPSAYLVPLLGPSTFCLLMAAAWGLPVKCTPHLHSVARQKTQTFLCLLPHTCACDKISAQLLQLSPSPALFSLTVTAFQDAHCSCHGGWWPRPPLSVFKERFKKEDRSNFIDQGTGCVQTSVVTSKPGCLYHFLSTPFPCSSPVLFH